MKNSQNQILSERKVKSILNRIAIEILENNFDANKIILVGITGQGSIMASLIRDELLRFRSSMEIISSTLSIDKGDPEHSDIAIDIDHSSITGQSLVIVDDVMNTGRTQAYALSYLMQFKPARVETAVLVNRSHTSFPVSVTYSGFSLSTTIDNHIQVKLEEEVGAYLH
jgi:pyrimidine operon attenuation protein/uracil phosphoribosyltransferase